MEEEPTTDGQGRPNGMLHRIGHLGATIGRQKPKKKSTRLIVQGGVAVLIFGFLVLTVVSQWSELREQGVAFDLIWLVPGVAAMLVFYTLSAALWGLILRFLDSPVTPAEAQRIWAQPLLVRYIPGSVLFVLARVLLAEKVGVSRRVSTVGLVYEQAASISAALSIATWFLIAHPDTQELWIRWLPILIIPVMVTLLHPRVFGPLTTRVLTSLGREPLPKMMPFRGVLTVYLCYLGLWSIMGVGVFFAARSVYSLDLSDFPIVAASQMIGFLAAVVSAVTPAGLGVRDAAFAWAVKAALPSGGFGVGAAIAIAVRATQTVVELIYVGVISWLARRRRIAEEGLAELVQEAEAEEALEAGRAETGTAPPV
jgi:glycosyltransferase 2 family protein